MGHGEGRGTEVRAVHFRIFLPHSHPLFGRVCTEKAHTSRLGRLEQCILYATHGSMGRGCAWGSVEWPDESGATIAFTVRTTTRTVVCSAENVVTLLAFTCLSPPHCAPKPLLV